MLPIKTIFESHRGVLDGAMLGAANAYAYEAKADNLGDDEIEFRANLMSRTQLALVKIGKSDAISIQIRKNDSDEIMYDSAKQPASQIYIGKNFIVASKGRPNNLLDAYAVRLLFHVSAAWGVYRSTTPEGMISRLYHKMSEKLSNIGIGVTPDEEGFTMILPTKSNGCDYNFMVKFVLNDDAVYIFFTAPSDYKFDTEIPEGSIGMIQVFELARGGFIFESGYPRENFASKESLASFENSKKSVANIMKSCLEV